MELLIILFVLMLLAVYLSIFAQKNNIPKKKVFATILINFVILSILHFFIAVVVLFVVLFNTKSFGMAFTSGGICLFVLPAFVGTYLLKRQKIENNETIKILQTAFPHMDYYCIAEKNSIAVNAQTQQVALVLGQKPKNLKVYPISLFKEVVAFRPGVKQTVVYDGPTPLSVSADNMRSILKGVGDTGLQLYLDDIEHPSVHVTMTYESAEKWMVLMRRLSEGTLESTLSPVCLS